MIDVTDVIKMRMNRYGWDSVSVPGGCGIPYNGLYRNFPLERGYDNFFKLEVYKRARVSQVEV